MMALNAVREQGHSHLATDILSKPGVIKKLTIENPLVPVLEMLGHFSPSARAACIMAEGAAEGLLRSSNNIRPVWGLIDDLKLEQKATIYAQDKVLKRLSEMSLDCHESILRDIKNMNSNDRLSCLKARGAVEALDLCALQKDKELGEFGASVLSMLCRYESKQLEQVFAQPHFFFDLIQSNPWRANWALGQVEHFTPLGQAQTLGKPSILPILKEMEERERQEGTEWSFSSRVFSMLNSKPFQQDPYLRHIVGNERTLREWGYQPAQPSSSAPASAAKPQ